MELVCDDDVKAVAEFMQSNMPASKLVSVASAVAALAPILWGGYEAQTVAGLRLVAGPISADRAERTAPTARSPLPDSLSVGDGSAAEAF